MSSDPTSVLNNIIEKIEHFALSQTQPADLTSQRYEPAEIAYQLALKQDPMNADTMEGLGLIQLNTGS